MFMLYNVPLSSVQSAFWIKFISSFSLIKLTIQRKSEPLMFKIAILLRFTDINHDIYCRYSVQTLKYNLEITSNDKYHTLLMHLCY